MNPGGCKGTMTVYQPMPGYWYANTIGQLQQVRIVLHEAGQPSCLIIENINGQRQAVKIEEWKELNLTLHSPGVECRHRRRDDKMDSSENQ